MKVISLSGFLRSSKIVHLDGKNLACFTQNLEQNLMSLVLMSKSERKKPKMLKTKVVRKNAYMRVSEAKGQKTDQVSAKSPKRGFFRHILIPFHLLMQNDLK